LANVAASTAAITGRHEYRAVKAMTMSCVLSPISAQKTSVKAARKPSIFFPPEGNAELSYSSFPEKNGDVS
jgi:hypothetical protein